MKINFLIIRLCLLSIFFLATSTLSAKVKLPKIFSSDMVLQRDKPIVIWGWADPGEQVTLNFINQSYKTTASPSGKWQVQMKSASAGGPYNLQVNDISLDNILMGDVWLCSGQSNMAFLLMNAERGEEAIKTSENPSIRLFTVPRNIEFKELDDVNGKASWQKCNPETVKKFSAVAYFMARRLQKDLQVPIGLVHSSYGGTMIEDFISAQSLDTIARLKPMLSETQGRDIKQYMDNRIRNLKAKYGEMKPYTDDSILWDTVKPVLPVPSDKWPVMKLPTLWEKAGLPNTDGVIWFYKEIKLDRDDLKKEAFLSLGRIADQSVTFFNGQKLAASIDSRDLIREYTIPAGLLKEGVNQVLVRVANKGRNGGIWGPLSKMYVKTSGKKMMIDGDWRFKIQDIKIAIHPNDIPASLYNAMISPLSSIQYKGVVWYQGESNANWANEYRNLLQTLIKDWRMNFKQPELPFIIVQLPNYKALSDSPQVNSSWALLREAQQESLQLPRVGLVVTIDLGVEDNIHPVFKEPVGERVALKALQMVYEKNVAADGPVFKSMTVQGNKVMVTFNSSSGLSLKKNTTNSNFMIAGVDRKFQWAQARLDGDKLILWNESIAKPVAIRYAWADNPGNSSLNNGAGLPAQPFRSDKWPVVLEEIPR